MRAILFFLSLITMAAPAAAQVTVYFQGTNAGNWVNGSFSYDPAAMGTIYEDAQYDVGEYWFDNFSFTTNYIDPLIGNASYSGAYRLAIGDAFAGQSGGMTDGLFALVPQGFEASFNLEFGRDDALDSVAPPSNLPAGLATFGYSFKGQGFTTPVSYSLTPFVSAIPEPATWAMMIVGFGAIGGTMRQRRRTFVQA